MTGNHTYSKMMLPAPVRVWRYRLWPMTVGHYAVLCRLDSPLIDGNKVPLAGDLASAIWVLKQDWRRAYKHLGQKAHTKFVLKIGKKFNRHPKFHIAVLNEFYKYWAWQNAAYDIWKKDEEGQPDRSMSWLQTIRWVLMNQWGYSSDEINDLPYKLAVNDCFGAMVANGKLEFVSDKQRARREYIMQNIKEENAI